MTTELTDQAALVAKPAARPEAMRQFRRRREAYVIGAGPGGLAARDNRVIFCGRTQYNSELELATHLEQHQWHPRQTASTAGRGP